MLQIILPENYYQKKNAETLNWDKTVIELKKYVLESRRSRDISEQTAKIFGLI